MRRAQRCSTNVRIWVPQHAREPLEGNRGVPEVDQRESKLQRARPRIVERSQGLGASGLFRLSHGLSFQAKERKARRTRLSHLDVVSIPINLRR